MHARSLLALLTGAVLMFSIPVVGSVIAQTAEPVISRPLPPDVPGDMYFSDAVNEMINLGVLRGYENGRFGPNDLITRAQVAVMFQRYDESVIQPLRTQIAALSALVGNQQCSGGHLLGESYPSVDGCNTCSCTMNGEVCTLRACAQSSSSSQSTMPGGSPLCSDGHRQGDSYMSPDGCNICNCTTRGEICTLRSCGASSSSVSSARAFCGNGICENGEAMSCGSENCPPGQYCALYCRPGSCESDCQSSSSSNTSIETGSCAPYICKDGTRAASCTADGHPINYFADPCLTHGGQIETR